MANTRNGNTWHVDSAGTLTTDKNVKVSHILFTSSGAGDSIVITDASGGNDKITLKQATANDTKQFEFEQSPLVFPNGIHITSLSTGAKAVLVIAG